MMIPELTRLKIMQEASAVTYNKNMLLAQIELLHNEIARLPEKLLLDRPSNVPEEANLSDYAGPLNEAVDNIGGILGNIDTLYATLKYRHANSLQTYARVLYELLPKNNNH